MPGMRRNFVLPALALVCIAAVAPAERFNVPGQHRTRTPGEMKGDKIPLRFADGTPTGFFAHADDPSKYGDNRKPAKVGFLELDAQEILVAPRGMKLLFHPGGGPDHYEDHVEKGQYGHVAVDDLKSPVKLAPVGLNGKPAPWKNGAAYLITPTRIPRDMWYKPNVSDEGRSGSTYFTYGNPGHDKTRGRGDWTYINWSWVQNGGDKYPENICRGGGMVRAIGQRGMTFTAADVAPVVGYSYGPDNQVNGRVTAFYGRTTTGGGGDKGGGSEIFGWLPHSYQKTGGVIVPCVRRSRAAKQPFQPAQSDDRMERMAWNLLSETPAEASRRTETVERYRTEADAAARMELLTELSRVDDAETVRVMFDLLAAEKEPRVREQAIALIGYMRSAPGEMTRVGDVFVKNFQRSADEDERMRTIEILGNFQTPESRAVLAAVRNGASPEEVKAVEQALARTQPSER